MQYLTLSKRPSFFFYRLIRYTELCGQLAKAGYTECRKIEREKKGMISEVRGDWSLMKHTVKKWWTSSYIYSTTTTPIAQFCCYQRRRTWTGDFKCREVKTGFYRNRSMQTGSSGTLIGWNSGQTTFVPLWDWMEGAWLRTLAKQCHWLTVWLIGKKNTTSRSWVK